MNQLKLSEAIRLGAVLRPQGHNALFWAGKTCALGAAMEAAGLKLTERQSDDGRMYRELEARWPILMMPFPGVDDLRCKIAILNDNEGLSREAIADFVATIEAQHPIPTEAQPEAQPELVAKC